VKNQAFDFLSFGHFPLTVGSHVAVRTEGGMIIKSLLKREESMPLSAEGRKKESVSEPRALPFGS